MQPLEDATANMPASVLGIQVTPVQRTPSCSASGATVAVMAGFVMLGDSLSCARRDRSSTVDVGQGHGRREGQEQGDDWVCCSWAGVGNGGEVGQHGTASVGSETSYLYRPIDAPSVNQMS